MRDVRRRGATVTLQTDQRQTDRMTANDSFFLSLIGGGASNVRLAWFARKRAQKGSRKDGRPNAHFSVGQRSQGTKK